MEKPVEDLRDTITRHRGLRRTRRLMKALPKEPRCKLCAAPFAGIGSKLVGPLGFAPSRNNPNLCKACVEDGPLRGTETDAGILFADVRGFTALAEQMGPGDVARLMNRFYQAAIALDLKGKSAPVVAHVIDRSPDSVADPARGSGLLLQAPPTRPPG